MCNAAAQNAIGVFDSGLGACDLFALLDEKDIPRFAEEAQKVWDTRGEIIRVELCEEVGA